jgi:hypothetical protein
VDVALVTEGNRSGGGGRLRGAGTLGFSAAAGLVRICEKRRREGRRGANHGALSSDWQRTQRRSSSGRRRSMEGVRHDMLLPQTNRPKRDVHTSDVVR